MTESTVSTDHNERPRRRPDVVRKGTPEETLLYDPHADAVHVLNRTAAVVWDLCDGRSTAREMEAVVRQSFAGGQEADVAADIRGVLARFEREGLLEPRAGGR